MSILNRRENYLAKIAGNTEAVEITPANRVEKQLNDIVANSSGGGDGSSTPDILMVNFYMNPMEGPVSLTCDKTFEEAFDAVVTGKIDATYRHGTYEYGNTMRLVDADYTRWDDEEPHMNFGFVSIGSGLSASTYCIEWYHGSQPTEVKTDYVLTKRNP